MTLPIVTPGPDTRRKSYAATGTPDTSAATSTLTDLVLEGGDGVGITIPDPGGDADLFVQFTASGVALAQCAAFFVLIVDGIPVAGTSPYTFDVFGNPSPVGAAASHKMRIKGGAPHTVRVRWRANVSTMSINPTNVGIPLFSNADAANHATLIVTVDHARSAEPSPYPVGQAELDAQRTILTNWTFGGPLPVALPDVVERDWSGAALPVGCAQIDRFTITDLGGRGGTGYAWLLIPTAPVGTKLILCHSGHEQSWDGDNIGGAGRTLENTQFWLAQGFHVLAVDMPTTAPPGRQPNPLTLVVDDVATPFTNHGFGALDDADDGLCRSLAPFLEPALRGATQALVDLGLTSYYAIGISGGGISVELLAAVDTRCRNRYSVFGGIAWEIRYSIPISHQNPADSEQWCLNPAMIRGAMHLMRYALGGDHGRRAVQIWGDLEPVTPVLNQRNEIAEFQGKVDALLDGAGDFVVYFDEDATLHQYTDDTLAWVAADIAANP